MAIYVGVIVGGFSGYVADTPTLSWRFAFDACGMAGILYAVPLALLLRDAPKSGDTDTVVAPGTSVVEAAKGLLGNGSFNLLVISPGRARSNSAGQNSLRRSAALVTWERPRH